MARRDQSLGLFREMAVLDKIRFEVEDYSGHDPLADPELWYDAICVTCRKLYELGAPLHDQEEAQRLREYLNHIVTKYAPPRKTAVSRIRYRRPVE